MFFLQVSLDERYFVRRTARDWGADRSYKEKMLAIKNYVSKLTLWL